MIALFVTVVVILFYCNPYLGFLTVSVVALFVTVVVIFVCYLFNSISKFITTLIHDRFWAGELWSSWESSLARYPTSVV